MLRNYKIDMSKMTMEQARKVPIPQGRPRAKPPPINKTKARMEKAKASYRAGKRMEKAKASYRAGKRMEKAKASYQAQRAAQFIDNDDRRPRQRQAGRGRTERYCASIGKVLNPRTGRCNKKAGQGKQANSTQTRASYYAEAKTLKNRHGIKAALSRFSKIQLVKFIAWAKSGKMGAGRHGDASWMRHRN